MVRIERPDSLQLFQEGGIYSTRITISWSAMNYPMSHSNQRRRRSFSFQQIEENRDAGQMITGGQFTLLTSFAIAIGKRQLSFRQADPIEFTGQLTREFSVCVK